MAVFCAIEKFINTISAMNKQKFFFIKLVLECRKL
jgi:hypothetical protein